MAALSPAHSECLSAEAATSLAEMAGRPWSDEFYLAGSAALALYLGHRPVRDLDLMGSSTRLTSRDRRDLLEDLLRLDAGCRVETARDGYMFVRLANGGGVRFFYYPYPLIAPEESSQGMHVASLLDLALMKLGAVISRGTRRDFVDIFLLCRRIPLATILERAGDKFGHVRDFELQALKGLADLSLVEGEPMPKLNEPLEWQEVETWVRREVREIGRSAVGLDRV